MGVKIGVLVLLTISLFVVAECYYLCRTGSMVVAGNIENGLRVLAASFAAALDGEKLKLLDSKAAYGGPVYRELQQKLQYLQKINENRIKNIYVIAKRGEGYYYILDAMPPGKQEQSKWGHPFAVKRFPAAIRGFLQPAAEKEPFYDQVRGLNLQSGFAPATDYRTNRG